MTHARLIFDDGTEFHGQLFTKGKECLAELVFNTSMIGYQEILSDPSYAGQMVLMTYPLIGNYGINTQDVESEKIFLEAILVKEYCDFPSSWRSEKSLKTYLEEEGKIGAEGFDTRAITKYLRQFGVKRAILTTDTAPTAEIANRLAKELPEMAGQNLAKAVTSSKPYIWEKNPSARFRVAVIDCGIKYNILRHLTQQGCECHVFPVSTPSQEIEKGQFDGLFVSNGPGDPEPVESAIDIIRWALGKIPIFGICLGHQLLALAMGAKTYKLQFGHHGANHPIKNLDTGKIEVTAQNHGFCVKVDTLPDDVEMTHINLNDQTCAGIRHKQYPAFSVQYHPEASPGPHDSHYLFKQFITMMEHTK